ncbi:MAG: biopolymer transporter ExbD [Treponema sp.]|nr:biopolymer transporter ExbD [Treponema sp.]
MKLRRRKNTAFSVPLFSTSDIAFLLLIFIMLIVLINFRKEVTIEYPEAHTALITNADKNLEVWIDIGGAVYLDGDPADLSALGQAIIELQQTDMNTQVHIIADRNTPYERVNAVLEVLQIYQYRFVSFVVRNVE